MGELVPPENIIAEFGLKHDSHFSCVSNSVVNSIKIWQVGENAKIYYVDREPITHAYVVCKNTVLNKGVTAEKVSKYTPDLELPILLAIGENRTSIYLNYALQAFFKDINLGGQILDYLPTYDFVKIRKQMEKVFPGGNLIQAANILQQVYIKLSKE
jgi:hypothetical protein